MSQTKFWILKELYVKKKKLYVIDFHDICMDMALDEHKSALVIIRVRDFFVNSDKKESLMTEGDGSTNKQVSCAMYVRGHAL